MREPCLTVSADCHTTLPENPIEPKWPKTTGKGKAEGKGGRTGEASGKASSKGKAEGKGGKTEGKGGGRDAWKPKADKNWDQTTWKNNSWTNKKEWDKSKSWGRKTW